MNTGTAASRAAAARFWTPVLEMAGQQAGELGEEVLAVAHQIAANALSAPLTDPGRSAQDREDLAARLFSAKADRRVVELLQCLVRGRWSKPVHLITALHDLGIEAILTGARSAGTLADVEHEIFAVMAQLEDNAQLRDALEPSRRTRTRNRVALAEQVFGGVLSGSTMTLLVWCVRHRTEGGVPRNLRRVANLAASLRGRVIADVVTAVPMTTVQRERLAAALQARLGSPVNINATVDPSVIGGMKVMVKDTVIDSTVRSSIDDLRTSLVG